MSGPIYHTKDPRHVATSIRCAVCTSCYLALQGRVQQCIYGGPFVGWDESWLQDKDRDDG
jgi:hypothetical protein